MWVGGWGEVPFLTDVIDCIAFTFDCDVIGFRQEGLCQFSRCHHGNENILIIGTLYLQFEILGFHVDYRLCPLRMLSQSNTIYYINYGPLGSPPGHVTGHMMSLGEGEIMSCPVAG